jgi:primosomal protein N' (replication factor Y)
MEKNGLIEKRKEFPQPVKRRKEKKIPSTFQLEIDFSRESESGKILNELLPRLDEPTFFPAVLMASRENRAKIYLELIRSALEKEKKVLVVLPEIPLAEIFQEKLKKHLITESVVFHGRLTEKAREAEWMRIKSGYIRVILGSRTALLAPVDRYGLIIVDQEENESFDQSDTGQLNIKKGAWIKAEANSAVMVLGSSSPTVETYFRAKKKGYLYSIREKSAAPTAEIVEVRREKNLLAPRLLEKIREKVSAGQQVLLFVNRRGYASYVFCPRCRHVPKCEHCEISLTYHKRDNKLVCHYCNYSQNVTGTCIKCGSRMIQNRGIGTELVTEKIKQAIAGIRVAAFDIDFVKRKRVRDRVIQDLTSRKIDVLVGTRLLANQVLLPPVSLVGILFPEEILMFGDFRSGQKTYQAIRKMMEFSGSRGEGEIVIQTDQPQHYCIRSAAENDYDLFYQQELEYRRLMRYPPFSVLTEIVFQGDNLRSVARESRKFISQVKSRSNKIEVLGPALAPLYRLKGKVRIQTVLKADKKQMLDAALSEVLKEIKSKFTIKIFE